MDYKAHIDGLRAVAILSVLFFHADFSWASGGYLGVDVFFVISGYLITSHIVAQISKGEFSLKNFYLRRMRRLLPALFCMLLVVTVAALFILTPSQLRYFSVNLIATLTYSSNVLLWKLTGYFAESAHQNPLLHTWSLSVEEQFYIFFPLFLMLVARQRKWLVAGIWGALIVSFVLHCYFEWASPRSAFYLIFSRAWELLIGSILAVKIIPPLNSKIFAEIIGLIGIGLIVLSVGYPDTFRIAPLPVFLWPCLGAAMVVWANEQKDPFAKKILSLKPLIFVGLISYSLYLWHWPIIVFVKQLTLFAEPTAARQILVIVLSFLFAYGSWIWIEKPFRRPPSYSWVSLRFRDALVCTIAFSVFGSFIYFSGGLPMRFSSQALEADAARKDFSVYRSKCHASDAKPIPFQEKCVLGVTDVDPDVVIWGDSHAVEIADMLSYAAKTHKKSIIQVTYTSCPPALGYESRAARHCKQHNDDIIKKLMRSKSIRNVVLVGRYHAYLDQDPNLLHEIEESIILLKNHGKDVFLVYPVPEFPGPVPVATAMLINESRSTDEYSIDQELFFHKNAKIIEFFDGLTVKVNRIKPYEILCRENRCRSFMNGSPLYYDGNHLSRFGAYQLASLFDPLVFASKSIEVGR